MMNHSIGIPDWIWEYWQYRSGKKNPASSIREELVRITTKYQLTEQTLQEPDNWLPDTINFDIQDTPTVIVTKHVDICRLCAKIISKGEEAFWYTSDRGRKLISHPECWRKSQPIQSID